MKKIVSLIAAGSLALTLAACGSNGGGNDEADVAPIETNVVELEPVNEVVTPVAPEPVATPTPTPEPAATGKEFDTSTTQEDAEATGMTSRVSRDEDAAAPAQ